MLDDELTFLRNKLKQSDYDGVDYARLDCDRRAFAAES